MRSRLAFGVAWPMASLPLSAAGLDAYYARINGPHDFTVEVDVLNMNERLLGQVTFLDGQVNFQRQERDSTNGIARTANLVLSDASDLLQVSMWQGQAFGNKMLRIRHVVDLPGYGEVTAEVGTFVISQPQGDSFELTVELQDKTALAARGTRPYKVRKGKNAVDAHTVVACLGDPHHVAVEHELLVGDAAASRVPDNLRPGRNPVRVEAVEPRPLHRGVPRLGAVLDLVAHSVVIDQHAGGVDHVVATPSA